MPPIHLTGKAAGELGHRGYHKFISGAFGTEMLYSVVIILCSLMVYRGTKELYELSNHRGIKYFRYAFLFFAIAYFIRTFIKFLLVYFNASGVLDIAPFAIGQITVFLFVYFITMAAFYLMYSLMFKKWKSQSTLKVFHAVSIFTGLLLATTRSLSLVLFVSAALLLFIFLAGYTAYKETKKKHSGLYTTYALLFAFLALNVLDIVVPSFLQLFQLAIYLISTAIFLKILYRVLTRTGT